MFYKTPRSISSKKSGKIIKKRFSLVAKLSFLTMLLLSASWSIQRHNETHLKNAQTEIKTEGISRVESPKITKSPGSALFDENSPVAYVHSSGTDNASSGSSATPYKTIAYAVGQVESGTIIYLKSNITISGQITINKSIKFMSDPDDSTVRSIIRNHIGAPMINMTSGDYEMVLENIKLDGNSKKSTINGFTILMSGTAETNPTLTILDGALLQNSSVVNGASVIQCTEGTINMYGGSVSNNKAETGITAFYAINAKGLNLLGGEIKSNSKSHTGSGAIWVKYNNYDSINVGRDMKIHSNTATSSKLNLNSEDHLVNVIENFEGEVHVYSNKYK